MVTWAHQMPRHPGGAAHAIDPSPLPSWTSLRLRPEGSPSCFSKARCGGVNGFNHGLCFLSSRSTAVTRRVGILKGGRSSLLRCGESGEGRQALFPVEDSATVCKPSPSPRGRMWGWPVSGCSERLTLLCAASSPASVSQDPRSEVPSLQGATPRCKGRPAGHRGAFCPVRPRLAQLCCGLVGGVIHVMDKGEDLG